MATFTRLPWVTRGLAAVCCPVVLTVPAYMKHGTGPAHDPPWPPLMSGGIYLFAWVLTGPVAFLEIKAAAAGWRWAARACASVALAVLALVGTLPVTFSFEPAPIAADDTRSAWISYLVLLGGYLVVSTTTAFIWDEALRHPDSADG